MIADDVFVSLDVSRASVKPASNRRSWNLQFREEIRIACLANRLADPVVIAASGKSCLHTMSYRHLDGSAFRIGFETYLVYKSMALQLQRANSRMSWNAAASNAAADGTEREGAAIALANAPSGWR